MRLLRRYIALSALLAGAPAMAIDWTVNAHVTMVETTYAPSRTVFTLDAAAGSCAAGTALNYYALGASNEDRNTNISAMIATLLTAHAAASVVTVGGLNSGCSVNYLQIR